MPTAVPLHNTTSEDRITPEFFWISSFLWNNLKGQINVQRPGKMKVHHLRLTGLIFENLARKVRAGIFSEIKPVFLCVVVHFR